MGHSRPLYLFLLVNFNTKNVINKKIVIIFEPWSSSVGRNLFVKCATTTEHLNILILK